MPNDREFETAYYNVVEATDWVNINDDYYTYDESTSSLIGNNNKRGYRLGDEVTVVVKSASKINHTIDFVLKR